MSGARSRGGAHSSITVRNQSFRRETLWRWEQTMSKRPGPAARQWVEVVRGDDTYRFFEDGSVEFTRKGIGAGVSASSIQDENVIQKTELQRDLTDTTGSAIRLGRTDMATFGADDRLREFRTTAAPGAVFDGEGNHLRGGSPEVKGSKKRWTEIARELKYLEGHIAKDVRNDPAVVEFYRRKAAG